MRQVRAELEGVGVGGLAGRVLAWLGEAWGRERVECGVHPRVVIIDWMAPGGGHGAGDGARGVLWRHTNAVVLP